MNGNHHHPLPIVIESSLLHDVRRCATIPADPLTTPGRNCDDPSDCHRTCPAPRRRPLPLRGAGQVRWQSDGSLQFLPGVVGGSAGIVAQR